MTEHTITKGDIYSFGFRDGANHVLDVLSQKIGALAPSFSNADVLDGYMYAMEEVLGIIGQARK